MLKGALIAVLLLLGAVLCVLAVAESSAYHQCVSKTEQQQSSQPKNERPSNIFMVRIVFRCLGDFVDKNHDAITAISTVVIAIFTVILGTFTVSLSKSTRIAAVAAKESADHIHRVERAYIFGDVFIEFGQDLSVLSRAPDNMVICVSNYGKTPGEVTRIAIEYCDKIPNIPDYSGDLHIGMWIGAGAEKVQTKIKRPLNDLTGKPGNVPAAVELGREALPTLSR